VVLRKELVGGRLLDVESVESRRLLVLHFTTGDEQRRALILEYGAPSGVALTNREGKILALSHPFRPSFRPGVQWVAPPEGPMGEAESRLASDFVHLRLARGAEQLFSEREQAHWTQAKAAPLRTKLKRLERTRQKVAADLARAEGAEVFRDEGELLAQNLHRVQRGQRSVTLTQYTEQGETQRVLTLEPSRTPKQEVEWRFHQYRRLLRGQTFARNRLRELEDEQRTLELALATVLSSGAAVPAEAPKRRATSERNAPYKTYRGHRDQPIWVGRGAAHNDTLTFKIARPWHIWFHARGVPGAHVVVPLGKNASLPPEALLDAAHLALFHSELKAEPRGEVSYVSVKHVRKGRDAPPGAVTYSGERTVMLRVEPARLQRLLATERLEVEL
jgi:predicted ribosome quality control (RQC) complex YloA/Tae2 family protein